jgi:hypothetical protein
VTQLQRPHLPVRRLVEDFESIQPYKNRGRTELKSPSKREIIIIIDRVVAGAAQQPPMRGL